MRLLAGREHSRFELRRKLAAEDPQLLERVLDALAERGLQSEDRFAEAYTRMRLNRGFGPLRILAELRQRGIDEALIREYLPRDDAFWRGRMQQAAERKFGAEPPADRNARTKMARFLQYRGFPEHLVRDLIFK